MIFFSTFFFMTYCQLTAQNKDSLLVYTEELDSLSISVSEYDYILVFDIYMCKDCVSSKIKEKKKIVLIPLDNDVMYENRIRTKLELKRDYPASDCYFLSNKEEKLAIIKKYQKNQLIKINKKSEI